MNAFHKEVSLNLPDFLRGKWIWLQAPVVLFLVLGFGYWSATHGYESKHVRYDGGFSGSSSGVSSDDNSIFAFKGQTITVDYNVKQLRRGRFWVHVFSAWGPVGQRDSVSRYIESTGPGSVELIARETGRYYVSCDGSPDGNGYDVTYTASWRVR